MFGDSNSQIKLRAKQNSSFFLLHIHYIFKYSQIQNTGELCCSGTNAFINFWLLSSVLWHEERDTILKSLSYHTMLTTPPNIQHILGCFRSQFIFAGQDPKNLTAAATIENSTLWQRTPFSAQWQKLNCLPAWSNLKSSTGVIF